MDGLARGSTRPRRGGQGTSRPTVRLLFFLALLASWRFIPAPSTHAQTQSETQTQAELARIERELKAAHPKYVEVCYDVSGSMENLGKFGPLREAVIPLLRNGLKVGDTVAVTYFDTEPRALFSRKLASEADLDAAIDALPSDVTPEKVGTNIRWPHHDAIRRAAERRLPASFVLLVSDSFNDTPAKADPAFGRYTQYYTIGPKGTELTKYPGSPQNRDYEAALAQARAQNIQTRGIGIGIDPATGRPREQLPRTPESKPEEPPPPATPPQKPKETAFPWLPVLGGLLAIALAGTWWALNQPTDVSLATGPKKYRNYRLRPKESIVLGGRAAKGDDNGHPIQGTTEPAAYIERGYRDFTLRPGEGARAGEAKVFLNNEEISAPRRIGFLDDLRVRVQRPGEEIPVDTRLQFGRAIHDDPI